MVCHWPLFPNEDTNLNINYIPLEQRLSNCQPHLLRSNPSAVHRVSVNYTHTYTRTRFIKFAPNTKPVLTKQGERAAVRRKKMQMGPWVGSQYLCEIETCGYTARATLRMIIISNGSNKTWRQRVTSSESSTAVLGTSDDALNVSFLLNYLT